MTLAEGRTSKKKTPRIFANLIVILENNARIAPEKERRKNRQTLNKTMKRHKSSRMNWGTCVLNSNWGGFIKRSEPNPGAGVSHEGKRPLKGVFETPRPSAVWDGP